MTWHMRNIERPLSVAATSMKNEMRGKEEERYEQMVKMIMQVELLAKHILDTRMKSVNAIGLNGVASHPEEVVLRRLMIRLDIWKTKE